MPAMYACITDTAETGSCEYQKFTKVWKKLEKSVKAKSQNSSSTQWHHFWLTKSTDETGRLYWEIIIAYLHYFYTLDKTFVIGYCQKEVIRPVALTSKAV